MEEKDLSVIMHHLDNKQTSLHMAESEIAKMQRQLVHQVDFYFAPNARLLALYIRYMSHVPRHSSHVTPNYCHA